MRFGTKPNGYTISNNITRFHMFTNFNESRLKNGSSASSSLDRDSLSYVEIGKGAVTRRVEIGTGSATNVGTGGATQRLEIRGTLVKRLL